MEVLSSNNRSKWGLILKIDKNWVQNVYLIKIGNVITSQNFDEIYMTYN